MNTAHFDALLWLETRRVGRSCSADRRHDRRSRPLRRERRATAENVVVIALGSGFGAVLIVPMTVSRDKLERTMDLRSCRRCRRSPPPASLRLPERLPNAVPAGARCWWSLLAPFDFVPAASHGRAVDPPHDGGVAAHRRERSYRALFAPELALIALVLALVPAWARGSPDDPVAAITIPRPPLGPRRDRRDPPR